MKAGNHISLLLFRRPAKVLINHSMRIINIIQNVRQDESCERKSSSEKCNCGCLKERQLTARTKCFVDVGGTLKCAETKSALHDVFVFSVNCSTSPKESRMNV